MQNFKKKFKQKPLIFSVLFFILCLGAFWVVNSEVARKNNLALSHRMEMENEISKKNQARLLNHFFTDFSLELKELESYFVYKDNVVELLQFIEDLAPEVGANAEIVSVDATKDGSTLFIEVRTRGTFEAVYDFLNLLENAPYKIEFVSMNIKAQGGEIETIWQSDAKLKILSFIPEI